MKGPLAFAGVLLLNLSLALVPARTAGLPAYGSPWRHDPPTAKMIYPVITTIDVPGAEVTGLNGINSAGEIAGYYGASSNDPHKHGFLVKNGELIPLDYPRAYATFAYGINDAGLVVGSAELQGGFIAVGFTYDGARFTTFRDGRRPVTIPFGINNFDDTVGGAGTLDTTRGFEQVGTRFKAINFPGNYVYAYGCGINNLGDIVGFTDKDAYSYINGQFNDLDVPGADWTHACGINDTGIIVGSFGSGDQYSGFALLSGTYFEFSYPGAAFTAVSGVNDSGVAVGQYTFDYEIWHGFVAPLNLASTPEER